MDDQTDWRSDLAAMRIILEAVAQRQPELTSHANLRALMQHQAAIRQDLQAILALLEALVDRLPPQST